MYLTKLFKIRGGVHPEDRKHLAANQSIEDLPLAPLLHVPLQQHIGNPATPAVRRGQRVAKGEVLATGQGPISAPVHAPTSGRVMGIGSFPAHHASGLSVRTITLQPDGEDRWMEGMEGVPDPFALDPDEVAARVSAAGIVGMGGATFPSAVKLNLRKKYQLHTLVINGAECEPYLTCDDRLMREHADGVLDGARIMAHALGVSQIIIGIENNKPQAQAAMVKAAAGDAKVRVARLPMRYPMGSEKHLVQTLTGRETPARGLTADIGVVVHNPATAFAVHQALRLGQPLVTRLVTVSGGAINRPRNLRVPLGTPIQHLIDHCGGFRVEPTRLISGGPMMGNPLPSTRVPIVKGSNGVLALTAQEVNARGASPCIRCASCVSACPCGLLPLDMAAHARDRGPGGDRPPGAHGLHRLRLLLLRLPVAHPAGAVLQLRQGRDGRPRARQAETDRDQAPDRTARGAHRGDPAGQARGDGRPQARGCRKAGSGGPDPGHVRRRPEFRRN